MEVQSVVVEPLPLKQRQLTFWLLLAFFLLSLPFLYLYATGYRFEFGEQTNLISTGGIYIAAERTGAEIYIDNELVRETRVFRRAFYAQNLDPRTHRVHVQKEGHHTWVKELPVLPHIVTEAQAFNLPLVPRVRVVAPFQTATGTQVLHSFELVASTTNAISVQKKFATTTLNRNTEYLSLVNLFSTTTATSTFLAKPVIGNLRDDETPPTTTVEIDPYKVEAFGVELVKEGDDIFATWVGSRESMPYYYCADTFPPYTPESTTTPESLTFQIPKEMRALTEDSIEFAHPVQVVPSDAVCKPSIKIDRLSQKISYYNFFPGSSDLVLLGLEDGVYVIEIDGRAWQNVQPLIHGENLEVRVSNGSIYVYDRELVYQIILN